ncbi:Histone deacetylase hda1 [Coemansia sp. RSA 2049]|nr:Histone deacetylase hda1 [Coemansia sp. Benny D160-2]KAJ2518032.1 Histone deacetylase hda1 [Coemansia sp. RSA 1939]KAJ2521119.1 Histone deacetylase hda1 [Coemansia sp. RSA 2049]KAJ2597724.1 Histone deacetylase hda1 [Coemansia sp. RSA 1804]KAJ2692657.1 Histone deacetylase hda1 [Coemansia sp. RSA 1285]
MQNAGSGFGPPDRKNVAVDGDERKVGFVYDIRMKYHLDLEDLNDPHPEDPRRIYWIHELLGRADCLKLMRQVKATPVTDAQILRVHSKKHLNFMKETEIMEKTTLVEAQQRFDSVFLCNETNYCARLSAGGLVALCTEVALGRLESGMAIIRPPGHHACPNRPMGFCILNNIAIAIRDLQEQRIVRKVMVVDWDVHHGNGIQEVFYGDRSVVYCSIHRHDGGEFFPSTSEGNMGMVGTGEGRGFNINIPWVCGGMGDGDYVYAFKNVVLPVAKEFGPDIIVVASGFDAAVCDPIGECDISPECYACMTSMLNSVCNRGLVLSLEGGYNLDATSNSALACVKALLNLGWKSGITPRPATYHAYATLSDWEINGVPMPHPRYSPDWLALPEWDPEIEVPDCFQSKPSELGKAVVDQVVQIQKQYWPSLSRAE